MSKRSSTSRFSSTPLGQALLVLGSLALVGAIYISVVQILRVDAFAKYRGNLTPLGAGEGIQLEGFVLRAYESGRLSAVADVKSAIVRRDRSSISLQDVSNGRYFNQDETMRFEAQQAVYQYYNSTLVASDGGRVAGDDLDLEVDDFMFNQKDKTLSVEGGISGRLMDGKVNAMTLLYHLPTESWKTNSVKWKGWQEDPVTQERKEWEFEAENASGENDINIWEKARASDGEVIVIADVVEHHTKTDVIVAKGNVRYYSEDANVLCEEATVYHDEQRAVLVGAVNMFIKSEGDNELKEIEIPKLKPSEPESNQPLSAVPTEEQEDVLRSTENVRDFPVKVVAERVEYWYKKGERRATITGKPQARQDLPQGWRMVWAHTAFYDGEADTITLQSEPESRTVRIISSIGDDATARTFTISTKEDVDRWKAEGISGKFSTSGDG